MLQVFTQVNFGCFCGAKHKIEGEHIWGTRMGDIWEEISDVYNKYLRRKASGTNQNTENTVHKSGDELTDIGFHKFQNRDKLVYRVELATCYTEEHSLYLFIMRASIIGTCAIWACYEFTIIEKIIPLCEFLNRNSCFIRNAICYTIIMLHDYCIQQDPNGATA